MNGCQTCGGFGMRHDLTAHGNEPEECTCVPYPYGDGPEIDCPQHGATDDDRGFFTYDEYGRRVTA